ncbi:bacillithiol system redox-active protein YtxJ [Rossellomorea vietnamensis]|uniref:Bacillithiol system redox-active protein YtxJ n=2 Tax=Rossellomorea TaxID=2837508 RepID=A0A5D4KJE1_9BACI|nr:bacillithiol system redox-active protein YtxJ [Rossellomorea vietnamensis]TYS84216.1 bacillithiol system redox-active protein YtxJ [Rossellomorea aquimaris]
MAVQAKQPHRLLLKGAGIVKKIETIEEFNQLLEEKDKFFFLKHSLTCPISGSAFDEYQKFAKETGEQEAYYLAVQESRDLSNHIAETFAIKHESPQAFLFKNGKPVWNESHWKITSKELASV